MNLCASKDKIIARWHSIILSLTLLELFVVANFKNMGNWSFCWVFKTEELLLSACVNREVIK